MIPIVFYEMGWVIPRPGYFYWNSEYKFEKSLKTLIFFFFNFFDIFGKVSGILGDHPGGVREAPGAQKPKKTNEKPKKNTKNINFLIKINIFWKISGGLGDHPGRVPGAPGGPPGAPRGPQTPSKQILMIPY